jgi:hypothetical protein
MSKGKEEYVEATLNQFLEQENAWEVSLSDMVESEDYKQQCPTPSSCDYEDFKRILFNLGMDTTYPIESQILSHRNWKGKVVNCERWVGVRRQDKEWLDFINQTNKYQNK